MTQLKLMNECITEGKVLPHLGFTFYEKQITRVNEGGV